MEKHLHIISFDIPYPANYGGVIDVFYKIKALCGLGIKIHLHCFEYNRAPHVILSEMCSSVHYYPRNTARSKLFNRQPYIVVSRTSDELIKNLLQDDYPILMEGLHSTFVLNDDRLAQRITMVRTHNVEHDYYNNLGRVESNIFKRYYFYNEAAKLETYEAILNKATTIAAISLNDTDYFNGKYGKAYYLPAFHRNETVCCKPGKGDYILYHGNLSVGENNEAAKYLINEIFSKCTHPFIIAGNKPSDELRELASKFQHIRLVDESSSETLQQLIANAHINILPTFQPTGIKLKLLSALYEGRFVMVNSIMITNTGLETLCIVEDNSKLVIKRINQLMKKRFTEVDILERINILTRYFSNEKNCMKLIEKLYN